MVQAKRNLYIRFGKIPEDGKSKIYRGDMAYGEQIGVSVWRAIEANGRYYPLLPEDTNEAGISDYFNLLFDKSRPVFLVVGTELFCEGQDREPLLANVKIIEEITNYYPNRKEYLK